MKQFLSLIAVAVVMPLNAQFRKPPAVPPLEEYVGRAVSRAQGATPHGGSPGSLFSGGTRFSDLIRDPRAGQIDDLVTILVSDRASAVARGVSTSSRKSSAKASVSALGGKFSPTGPLANLAGLASDTALDGQGETSRETQLTTSLSARVSHVLPNGYLVLEGVKEITVNSERQIVVVRGVCRPQDLTPGNLIRSERLAQLEIRISGKGVVGDAIRRPHLLYRILLGLLPL